MNNRVANFDHTGNYKGKLLFRLSISLLRRTNIGSADAKQFGITIKLRVNFKLMAVSHPEDFHLTVTLISNARFYSLLVFEFLLELSFYTGDLEC